MKSSTNESSIVTPTRASPRRVYWGGVYLNTHGCAPLIRWRYVICERSLYKRVRAGAPPPHSAQDFLRVVPLVCDLTPLTRALLLF